VIGNGHHSGNDFDREELAVTSKRGIWNSRFLRIGLAVSTLMLGAIGPVAALERSAKDGAEAVKDTEITAIIDGIDFGDNSSAWANDGECDDPRFEGPGTAVELVPEDQGRDAGDCSTLYEAGEISLIPDPADIVGDIDFGDNSSQWANDGECDDPRFDGGGADDILLAEDMAKDANDCRALFLSGEIIYLGDDPTMEVITFDGIEFGDNTSQWSNDLECDDPRFSGNGMAAVLVEDDLMRDANDCLALYQSGDITLANTDIPIDNSPGPDVAGIDFGDDTSAYANDGECDDPRFEGPGTAGILLDDDQMRDATDCSTLFASGQITLIAGQDSGPGVPNVAGIDFGDDSSTWSNDGECDDPRFTGPGSAETLLDEDMGRDATDCSTLFANGQVTLIGDGGGVVPLAVDFGTDEGRWTEDGECDDPRFFGEGMAAKLILEDLGRDATDCQTLFDAGLISLIDASNFDFGDDGSRWANDGECDDPRFTGEGMAAKLDPLDFGHDATDCQAAFDAGSVDYAGGFLSVVSPDLGAGAATTGSIDFGDDSSTWSNDGECDDPRFAGPGVAATLLDEDMGRDATDCSTLFEAGEIYLSQAGDGAVTDFGIDFGDNSSDYANNGQCDDPRFAGPGVADILLAEDQGRDADDCRNLYEGGQIGLLEEFLIDFGDDSSAYANDGECDDPRFAGKGVAATLLDDDLARDASDCRAAFEAGKIYLIEDGAIDFGDDSSEWANDDECDDPRFAGPGSAGTLVEDNIKRDASDCRAAYRANRIYLI
jgi:hypothetical protein